MNTVEFERKLDLCIKKIDREIDLDWSEIRDELGLTCSHDHLRKLSYAYKEYNEYIQAKGIDEVSSDMYDKLIDKELDIKKQMTKLSDMRVAVSKETREQARYESLLELLSDSIKVMDGKFKSSSNVKTDSMKECIVTLSDLHYGIDINNSWNVYNSDVAVHRMNRVIDKAIEIGKSNKCEIIHFCCLGDLVNGNIHLTSRLSNRENIAQQVTGVSELISIALGRLSEEFEYVLCHMNSGNHDRILPEKKMNGYEDTYINIIKDYVKIKTSNLENIIYNDNKDGSHISEFNVCGKKVIACHGDKMSSKQLIPRLSSMYGKVDYVLRGHVHNDNSESFADGKVITVSSFSGSDTYSLQLGFNSPPSQKIIVLEKDSNDELIYNVDLSRIGE